MAFVYFLLVLYSRGVAQLVERWPKKPKVRGSNPRISDEGRIQFCLEQKQN